ncbi:MAG: hypothetical protein AB3X41_09540 [Leptothrix ochracea]|uniref:hypothetical protein n=1 Tax=Leptothrix ochracea TaxID=735331 RepID=UPI0034E29FFE
MRAYQTQQIISESHVLTVQLPDDAPLGLAQVIVLYPEPARQETTPQQTQDLSRFMEMLAALPPSGRSDLDIEQQIRAERDAWE